MATEERQRRERKKRSSRIRRGELQHAPHRFYWNRKEKKEGLGQWTALKEFVTDTSVSVSVGDPWHVGADPDPNFVVKFCGKILFCRVYFGPIKPNLWEKGRIRSRIRTSDYWIREARKHADPADPVPDPDPQHWFQWWDLPLLLQSTLVDQRMDFIGALDFRR